MGLFSFIGKNRQSLCGSGVLCGMSDRHTHILPGVDDGLGTMEESLEVLAYMESLGVKEVWCTPHVMDDLPNKTEALRVRFEELKREYSGPVILRLAAEYMLDQDFEARLDAGDLLLMDDEIVLVETSANTPPYNLLEMLERIMNKGYRPMMAHPERNRYMEMTDYRQLQELGVFFQLNIGSLVGYYGEAAQKKARMLLEKGWYYAAGSDCHRLSSIREQYNKANLPTDIIDNLRGLL